MSGVQAVLQVRSRWMGSTRAVDMIITVDPELSTLEAHEIADQIEALLETQFKVRDVSILGFWMTPFQKRLFENYIEEHGGRIRLDSRPGEGTTVALQLPLEKGGA